MLRSFGSRALVVGILGIAASGMSGSAGCSATNPTEIVPGALSQIEVPHDLAGVRVQVKANGSVKYDQTKSVTNGVVFLPATLGVIAGGSAETTVTVTVAGYSQAAVLNPMGEYSSGTGLLSEVGTTKDSSPSVRRTSVLTYVNQRTIFLPMNLSYSCWGAPCSTTDPESTTCQANSCASSAVDSSKLVDFDPSLVDGTEDCFSPSNCFTPATTAVPVNAAKCIYEVPPDEVQGLGLNVRVLYQDFQPAKTPGGPPTTVPTSEQEVLNEEPLAALAEGYAIPDPAKPLQFQLASGLCDLVHAATVPPPASKIPASGIYHTISAVQVSTTCPAKLPLLPVCADEQSAPTLGADGGATNTVVCGQPITLDPAPSAIYMVMDNSSIMSGAFGPEGKATAMGLALSNPLFKRTYVAFDFLDHQASGCTGTSTSYTTLAPFGTSAATSLDFTLANVGQPTVGNLLGNPHPPEPPFPDGGTPAGGYAPLYLEAAMRLDQGVYKHLQDFTASLNEPTQISAAMFFVNRQPDSTGAGDAGDFAADGGVNDLLPAPSSACSEIQPPLPSGVACTTPGGVDCSPALDTMGDTSAQAAQNGLVQQIVAADKAGMQSYFVILNNAIYQVGTPLPYFQNIQSLVKAQGVNTMQVLDATQPLNKLGNLLATFADTITPLGTCLYELPPGIDTRAKVQFTVPIPIPAGVVPGLSMSISPAPAPITVNYNASCTAATQGSGAGWAIEGTPGGIQHLRICGNDCSFIRGVVLGVSALSQLNAGDAGADGGSVPVPEVPVSATMPCADGGM
jgi:hypothetical protein